MKFLIIANPVSGGKKGKKRLPEIQKLLKKHNINYDLKKTNITAMLKQLLKPRILKNIMALL